ncbi:hypothetical protein WG66_002020 [Moniliophthora roreri]|nr:hypothetical protein WG66_002020 [Moniliophthora roreri]
MCHTGGIAPCIPQNRFTFFLNCLYCRQVRSLQELKNSEGFHRSIKSQKM